jgi:hypothetical protein
VRIHSTNIPRVPSSLVLVPGLHWVLEMLLKKIPNPYNCPFSGGDRLETPSVVQRAYAAWIKTKYLRAQGMGWQRQGEMMPELTAE